MIGVIADDLTGAAEIGAVSLRYGLRAEVVVEGLPSGQADVVCLDTNSRSCAAAEAAQRAATAARLLAASGASWIYKKVDSVLRGQVTAEIEAILKELRLNAALLAPANPSLGRVIRDGRYFVGGKPINETEFARDPEYPRASASVLDLLGRSGDCPLQVCRVNGSLPQKGIAVCEVASKADLNHWAARRTDLNLLAGGAEFWGAVLGRSLGAPASLPATSLPHPVKDAGALRLFVCGTLSDAAREFVNSARDSGTPIFTLPQELAHGAKFTATAARAIAHEVSDALRSHRRAILSIGLPPVRNPAIARTLAVCLVHVAEQVLRQAPIGHVYAEGGATAYELIRRMGWSRMAVVEELAPGVATLVVGDRQTLRLTIKPGSYVWPRHV